MTRVAPASLASWMKAVPRGPVAPSTRTLSFAWIPALRSDRSALVPTTPIAVAVIKDRAAFVDAMHARFHARVEAVVGEAIAGLPLGAERLFRGSETYLDVSLANRGVKALSLEARSDPAVQGSMEARRERLAAAGVADLEAMGWEDAEAAAQLLAAMTREISVLEFDAGHRLPASRRALKRFLGI